MPAETQWAKTPNALLQSPFCSQLRTFSIVVQHSFRGTAIFVYFAQNSYCNIPAEQF